MKSTIFRRLRMTALALIAGSAVLLSSCFTIPRTFKLVVDPNNPVEQNVIITFTNNTSRGYFIMKEWNGSPINEDLYGKKGWRSNDKIRLTVPVGDNSFTFDVRYTFSTQYSSYTYRMEDIELRYNLEPEKAYQVKGRTKSLGIFKGDEFFVGIYDITKGSTLLKEWKVGES